MGSTTTGRRTTALPRAVAALGRALAKENVPWRLAPVYRCASPRRFEASLLDAVRELVEG